VLGGGRGCWGSGQGAHTLQWDRVEAGWPSEDLCLLRFACSNGGSNTQKKKLNMTEADRAMTPGAWGACSLSES
jgi:hypothetical protein